MRRFPFARHLMHAHPRSRRRSRAAGAAALILAGATLAGCGIGDLSTSVDKAVDKAVAVLDAAIMDLNRNSSEWQQILRRVSDELPDEINASIRTEAQNLVDRSIATVGTEFRCSVDFLGARAVASLERLKSWLRQTEAPPPTPPAACDVIPQSIDLKLPPDRWSVATIAGYDLDHPDGSGRLLAVQLLAADGSTVPLPEAAIGRTTHYRVTLNLADVARAMVERDIVKVQVTWNDKAQGFPEVVVQQWTAQRIEIDVPTAYSEFVPPTTRGDNDFDTDADNYMTVNVVASTELAPGALLGRIWMTAQERDPDYTTVEGTRVTPLCTAPDGYRIVSASPSRLSAEVNRHVTTHGEFTWPQAANHVAVEFKVRGDTDADEAGSYTGVVVQWAAFRVTLEPTEPSWFSGGGAPTSCK